MSEAIGYTLDTPFGSPIAVSVLSPILGPRNFGGLLRGLLLEIQNLDSTNSVTVNLVPIPGGTNPDSAKTTSITVAAGKSGSIELEPWILRQQWEVTAQTAGPSYPTVEVLLQLSLYIKQTLYAFR